MATKLSTAEFDNFINKSKSEIEQAYQTLQSADQKFTVLNDYTGAYQTAIADSWVNNYSKAVQSIATMYNAILTANKGATNIASTDAQIAQQRP